MKLLVNILIAACLAGACTASRGNPGSPGHAPWSRRMADSFLARHPEAVTYDSVSRNEKWNYEQGLMLVALLRVWRSSGDDRYFEFVRRNLDRYVGGDGIIGTYDLTDFNLDNVGPGRALLDMYRKTGVQKYRAAADVLRRQLREQPRTTEGGFWHKKIYPSQMWLDGLFMAEPFYADYAKEFGEEKTFDDVADQFILIARHTRDSSTGLMYHGWDESRKERWADPQTGCSRSFWARGIGWYAMGLVDVLDDLPARHQKREALLGIFRNLAGALLRCRDVQSRLWYQVPDCRGREGNYLEASASCMVAYAFAKGAHRGYLDAGYLSAARESFQAVIDRFVVDDSSGLVDLRGTCRSAGLGGSPYRDGTYTYYVSEPQQTNDLKGIGAFLLAATELERGSYQR